MFTLNFEPSVGARPFYFGSTRADVRAMISTEPTVVDGEPRNDKYASLGIFLAFDEADKLCYLEVARPSIPLYDGSNLLRVAINVR